MKETQDRLGIAMRVSRSTLIGNAVLSAGKLVVGILAHSGALISDAVHSASDVASTLIVMLGLKLAGKEPDEEHPYGHERFECVCGAVLASLLVMTGLVIGKNAVVRLISGEIPAIPGITALITAFVSILVKEIMYQMTMRAAIQISSPALKADAWHHRSDALSSIGSFAGILGARLGFPQADAAASLVICAFILKVGYDILMDSMHGVVDTACDTDTSKEMEEVIRGVPGVLGIDLLNTRVFGSKIYVDVEISADGEMKLIDSHKIAEDVHAAVEARFGNVKHCMVHVNPKQKEIPA